MRRTSQYELFTRLALGAVLLLALALRVWYAQAWPSQHRFWDERYSLMNVRSILEDRTLLPASSYYPSPVVNLPAAGAVALSDWVYEISGSEAFAAEFGESWTPGAYRATRGLQCLYGVAAVWLIFLAGRRLAGPAVGAIAALPMAFMPWHIHASGYFKPDAMLVAAVVFTLWAGLRSIDRPGARGALVVGLGVALAASSKLTGVLTALPYGLVMAALGLRDRARWRDLIVAGVGSFVFFVALNPYWRAYPHWISSLRDDYAMRAGWMQMTRGQMPGRLFDFLADGATLGPLVWVALLGALALAVGAVLARRESPSRGQVALLLVFPIAYPVVYAFQTAYFKPNQLLPVVPFLCLSAAWLLVVAAGFVSRGLPTGWRRPAGFAAFGFLGLTLFALGFLWVYRSLVPTTLDVARSSLESRASIGRSYLVEPFPIAGNPWEGSRRRPRSRPLLVPTADVSQHTEADLARFDGVIYLSDRPRAAPSVGDSEATSIEPGWFRIRGPALTLLSHPLRKAGRRRQLELSPCEPGCLETRLPAGLRWVSFVLEGPTLPHLESARPTELRIAGEPVELYSTPVPGRVQRFATERVRVPSKGRRLVLTGPWDPGSPPSLTVFPWRRPAGGPAAPSRRAVAPAPRSGR